MLDIKWKRINPESTNKFNLSQVDFYQMFAYREKYLEGKGKLVLIYPKTDKFAPPIEGHFAFLKDLTLWMLPFDIKKDGASQLILPDASSLSEEIICSAA
ncbi:hypothetical protein NGM67_11100 [Photobacterium damselae]|uniref:5-methylcytosine restriction system specificity protein McrC n=1 Tax=Photobacterium damselae TaxID=38293 RepID=UPI0020915E01|nr:hypothetical protein [Photobacterium damselae]USR78293.1 hypothetical protein NGM67_11100 [Photobacterium damselae]